MDGCTLDFEGEKERVIKCLEAAIQRRVSEVGEKLKPSSTSYIYSIAEEVQMWLTISFYLAGSKTGAVCER